MGCIGIMCSDHGFEPGEKIIFSRTRNYDSERFVLPSSTERYDPRPGRTILSGKIKSSAHAMRELDQPLFEKFSRFRFHDLRHTYASLLIHQKENIKYIQNQLGHLSPMVTLNVYAHLMEPKNQEAACRLESAIFGNGHVLGTKSVGN